MWEKHPTMQLQDFIKKIVETKSKNEEDIIIRNNLEFLKNEINNKKKINDAKMIEYIIRSIYSEMMGHSAEFMHFQAINLIQNSSILMKKIGYLACTLFLEENSEFKILLVSPLNKDLESKQDIIVIIALNSLMKMITSNFAESFSAILLKLLKHKNILIKKKAINCIFKIKQISPDSFPEYYTLINEWLLEYEVCIINTVLNIIFEESKKNVEEFLKLYKPICNIFDQILKNVGSFETYDNIPEPWLQVKILQILDLFLKHDKSISGYLYPLILKCIRKSNNLLCDVSFMILYQSLLTISNYKINEEDLKVINDIIFKFLYRKHENPNLLYLGLKAWKKLTKFNIECLNNHQGFVIECLISRDESIKRITLELLYLNATKSNVEVIVEKLIANLESTNDTYFKKKINKYIFNLVEKLASENYFVETIINLLIISPDEITENKFSKIISIFKENIEFNEDFANYLIEKFYNLFLDEDKLNDKIIKIGVFLISNYGIECYKDKRDSLEYFLNLFKKQFMSNSVDIDTKLWIFQNLNKFRNDFDIKDIFCQKIIEHINLSTSNELKWRLKLLNNESINFSWEEEINSINYDFKFALDNFTSNNLKNYDKEKSKKILEEDINNTDNLRLFYDEEANKKMKIGKIDEQLMVKSNKVWTESGYSKKDNNIKQQNNFKMKNFMNDMKNFKPKQKITEKIIKNETDEKNKNLANILFKKTNDPILKLNNTTENNNNEGEEDIFGFSSNKTVINLQPISIDPQEYWDIIDNEHEGSMKLNLNFQNFKKKFTDLGFSELSVADNELIYGALYNNKKILLYLPYEENEEIDYILKCEQSGDIQIINNYINN